MSPDVQDPWSLVAVPHLARLGQALRAVQDRVAHTHASAEVTSEAAAALERAAALLDPYMYDVVTDRSWDDGSRAWGTRTLSPVLTDVVLDGDGLEATVRFTPFHLGANGAVHGGVLPLVFDEALARVSNFGRDTGRTAYLKVDYRSVTPLERDLKISAHVERIEGRKRFLAGALRDGDVITAEATALYVELKDDAD
jgi:acyl-coenzyme A thioesterase PaaI-like protein